MGKDVEGQKRLIYLFKVPRPMMRLIKCIYDDDN